MTALEPRAYTEGSPHDIRYFPKPPAWVEDAVCATIGEVEFYPEKWARPVAAIKVCGTCPVQRQCFEYALSNHETDGVWGGYWFGHYSEKRRPRGRRSA